MCAFGVMREGHMYIMDWFKPIFPLFLTWLIQKLQFLIPMVNTPPILFAKLLLWYAGLHCQTGEKSKQWNLWQGYFILYWALFFFMGIIQKTMIIYILWFRGITRNRLGLQVICICSHTSKHETINIFKHQQSFLKFPIFSETCT